VTTTAELETELTEAECAAAAAAQQKQQTTMMVTPMTINKGIKTMTMMMPVEIELLQKPVPSPLVGHLFLSQP
jgi:hypothetical protein